MEPVTYDPYPWYPPEGWSPISNLPDELILGIFSYLKLSSLARSCQVSKEWKRLASDQSLWKHTFYREIAFGTDKWIKCFGEDVVKNEDIKEEFESLSICMDEFKKFKLAFPDKNTKKSLMLVRLPKSLNGQISLKSLGNLAQRYFNSKKGYARWLKIFNTIEMNTIDRSGWRLMTTECLKVCECPKVLCFGDCNRVLGENFVEQQKRVADLAKKGLLGYEIPTALEAATCILAQYFDSHSRYPLCKDDTKYLFSDTWIRCQDTIGNLQIQVGYFKCSAGLDISGDSPHRRHINTGVAACFKVMGV
jgi:hypothetical protein